LPSAPAGSPGSTSLETHLGILHRERHREEAAHRVAHERGTPVCDGPEYAAQEPRAVRPVKATHGYTKQGAGYGSSGVKGLNALIATLSTPTSAPLIAATRLRKGSANSARGADRLIADALATTKQCCVTGLVIVRADSAYFNHDVVAAARRGGAKVSITARMNPAVLRAIAGIKESAWTPIHYPNAIWDEQEQRLVSDAQVAEIPFTAFTSRTKAEHVDGRLIVRRVKRLNRASVPSNQGELFATYRHHAIFTDTTLEMLQAETTHRGHAIIEQVHADLRAGPLAHLPSSSFSANDAWLVLAAIAFNLTRAAGAIASVFSRQGHHRHHP